MYFAMQQDSGVENAPRVYMAQIRSVPTRSHKHPHPHLPKTPCDHLYFQLFHQRLIVFYTWDSESSKHHFTISKCYLYSGLIMLATEWYKLHKGIYITNTLYILDYKCNVYNIHSILVKGNSVIGNWDEIRPMLKWPWIVYYEPELCGMAFFTRIPWLPNNKVNPSQGPRPRLTWPGSAR